MTVSRRAAIPLPATAMWVVTRAKQRRLEKEKQECLEDCISLLPDGILGDIVSLLPLRTAHARRSSPPGGALYGTPLPSTSTSTAILSARSAASSPRTQAPALEASVCVLVGEMTG